MQRATPQIWNSIEETARWSYAAEMLDTIGAEGISAMLDKAQDHCCAGDPDAARFWLDIADRAITLAGAALH